MDGGEFRCGLGDFVVGIGLGDDAAAGVGIGGAAVGRQLRAADGHHPAPVAALGRTSQPRPRRSRGRPRARRSVGRGRGGHAADRRESGCSAAARSKAVVDVSRSRPVIGVYRCQTAAVLTQLRCPARICRSTHNGSSALRIASTTSLVLVAVLGRLRRAPSPLARSASGSGSRGAEPGERPAGHPVAAPSNQQLGARAHERGAGVRAACRASGRREYALAVGSADDEPAQRWFGHPAVRRPPAATPGPSTTLCRPLSGSCSLRNAARMRARCSSGAGIVCRDPHRRAAGRGGPVR